MLWFLISLIIMFILLFSGIWIASAFGITGLVSLWPILGANFFALVGTMSWRLSRDFVIIAIPLFIFMGEILFNTGMMNKLYSNMVNLVPRWLRGGLLHVNIGTCTLFAAMSGSSVACAATVGRLAHADLVHRGYDSKLTLGSIAAGGTLGILIPPSIVFIVYALLVEESVAKLFMAGVFPGLILMGLLFLVIAIRVQMNPSLVPNETLEKINVTMKIKSFLNIFPFFLLIIVVLGSIYAGIATPTEASSFGCAGAVLLGMIYKRLTWKVLVDAARSATITSAFIFFIIIAATVMKQAVGYYDVPDLMESFVTWIGSSRLLLYVMLMVMYVILGCILDPMGMTLLTLPFVMPLLQAAGFDAIWFGVVFVIVTEMAQLTPPIGFNLFILQGVCNVPFQDVVKGSIPFLSAHGALLVLMYLFPQIALWLPQFV